MAYIINDGIILTSLTFHTAVVAVAININRSTTPTPPTATQRPSNMQLRSSLRTKSTFHLIKASRKGLHFGSESSPVVLRPQHCMFKHAAFACFWGLPESGSVPIGFPGYYKLHLIHECTSVQVLHSGAALPTRFHTAERCSSFGSTGWIGSILSVPRGGSASLSISTQFIPQACMLACLHFLPLFIPCPLPPGHHFQDRIDAGKLTLLMF